MVFMVTNVLLLSGHGCLPDEHRSRRDGTGDEDAAAYQHSRSEGVLQDTQYANADPVAIVFGGFALCGWLS